MNQKTEELVVHICDKLKNDETFGSVVLNKVLYYIDNTSYLKTGKPVSGFSYIKQKAGPTPKPASFLALRDKLCGEKRLEIIEEDYFGKTKKRPSSKTHANLEDFSAVEIDLINSVIEQFKGINAQVASDFSHNELGWKLASLGEEIPFYSYLLNEEEPTEQDVVWAREVIINARTQPSA